MKIFIGNKEYEVEIADTEELREKGLQDREALNESEGMLFVLDSPEDVYFWMKDTTIPLDIIFINESYEVISVHKGEPLSEEEISESNVKYILEVNQDSGITESDELELDFDDLDEEEITLLVLDEKGKSQYELKGGERIFSRKNTRVLVSKAKKAYKSKSDSDYKALGKQIFKYLKIQDNNDPQYVDIKKEE